MKYVIKNPIYGYYVGHVCVPRFRRKRGLDEIFEFATREEAQQVLKDRKKYPGLEDCTIEPLKEGD